MTVTKPFLLSIFCSSIMRKKAKEGKTNLCIHTCMHIPNSKNNTHYKTFH